MDTLCWKCKNACGNCSWSKFGVPMKGWVAKETKIKGYLGKIKSYIVYDCPEYEFDGKDYSIYKSPYFWSEKDIERLINLKKQNKTLKECAIELKKSKSSVQEKIKKLKLMNKI